jgi:hypothetical protein
MVVCGAGQRNGKPPLAGAQKSVAAEGTLNNSRGGITMVRGEERTAGVLVIQVMV